MSYKKIIIAGGGVLGSQIAFQAAYCGFEVTIWLRSEGSISRTKPKLDHLKDVYIETINKMANKEIWAVGIADEETFNKKECLKKVEDAYNNIKLELDLAKAVKDADLVIESMAEIKNAKMEFYKTLAPLLDEKTVVVSNSSTLLPSTFAKATGRANKFLSLHFSNEIWINNIAEVMAQSKTDMKYFDEVISFAKEIRMLPLPVKKEKAGYLLNSMLVPFLMAALDLLAEGISDVESIDNAWKFGTGAAMGPFVFLDKIGLVTALNIVEMYLHIPQFLAPFHFKDIYKLLKKYVDEGKVGESAGEGFYKYK